MTDTQQASRDHTEGLEHSRPTSILEITDKTLEAGDAVSHHEKDSEVERRESAWVGLSRWQAIWKFKRASMYVLVCCVGVMMDGFENSLPGGIIANEGFINVFGTITTATGAKALDSKYLSAWSGVSYVAQVAGNLCGGVISDRFGRRASLFAMTGVFAIGIIVEIVARNWQHWMVAKVLTGIGQGLTQSTMVTFMAELSPSQIRGALLATYGLGYAMGQLFVAIALQVVNETNPLTYLRAIYAMWVPLGLWFGLLLLLPESPWYHARKDQAVKAKRSLSRLYKNVEGYDVDREYEAMILEIEHERQLKMEASTIGWKDILMGTNLKRTFASVFALATQKWAGSSVVFNYTTYFFQQAGIPKPFQANVIVFCILIFSIAMSFYVVERIGRRSLILWGLVITAVLNVIIGTMGVIKQTTASQNATLAVICIWVWVYALGFAGTGWILAGEVATPRLRAKTAAFTAASNGVAGAIYDTTVPLMISKNGSGARGWGLKTLYMFAILSGVGAVINYFIIPETKGRSFNELDEMYEERIPPRKMKHYRTRVEISGLKQH